MKRFFLLSALATFALSTLLISCDKDDNGGGGGGGNPPVAGRTIKYEVTGSYTGSFTVVYIDADGSDEAVTVNSLPWSVEITIPNASLPASSGIGVSAVVGQPGVTGQKAMSLIYDEGVIVQSSAEQIANGDGYINSIPTLAHVVQ